jgi:hypothetical protein
MGGIALPYFSKSYGFINPVKRKIVMYETNLQVNLQRRKDFEREADNERLARSVQKDEKSNPLRNVVNMLLNKSEERNQG